MKKHAIKFIMVALIVSIALIGCDDAFRRVSQDEADRIAFMAAISFYQTSYYYEAIEDDVFDLSEIGGDGLTITIDPDDGSVEISWEDFDVGASIIARLEDETVPEEYLPNPNHFIDDSKVVIVSGTAEGDMDEANLDITMKLKFNDLESDGIPNGIYNVVIEMRDAASMNRSISITVNGLRSNFDIMDLQ